MREIKFRAWNKLTNKMYSHKDLEDVLVNLTKNDFISGIFLPLNSDNELMQYTGLKDIEGKEIYEGDIVQIYDVQDGKFSESTYSIIYNTKSEWTVDNYWLLSRKHHKCKIIGNIYENPELLV